MPLIWRRVEQTWCLKWGSLLSCVLMVTHLRRMKNNTILFMAVWREAAGGILGDVTSACMSP